MDSPPYIFAEPDLPTVLGNQQRKLREEVSQYPETSLVPGRFGATEAQVIDKFSIASIEIDWSKESPKKEEVKETRPGDFGRGRTIQRLEVVLRITVPFLGDRHIFNFSPTPFPNIVPKALVREGELELVYQAPQHELARLRQEHDKNVGLIKSCVAMTNQLLDVYHTQLPALVRQALTARRDQLNVVDMTGPHFLSHPE